jgi:predicted  nucleic acid-binding Zn-ribbon protein
VAMGEMTESRDPVLRWLEDGQRQIPALVGALHETERLKDRLAALEIEMEKLRPLVYEVEQVRNRAETTERLADRLREQLTGAEAELERHNRERTEVAERLTEFMNDVLLRLRPRTNVAEAA